MGAGRSPPPRTGDRHRPRQRDLHYKNKGFRHEFGQTSFSAPSASAVLGTDARTSTRRTRGPRPIFNKLSSSEVVPFATAGPDVSRIT